MNRIARLGLSVCFVFFIALNAHVMACAQKHHNAKQDGNTASRAATTNSVTVDSCPVASQLDAIYLGWNTRFDTITGKPYRFGLFLDSSWTDKHHAFRYYESYTDSSGNWTTRWKNAADPQWHQGGTFPQGWLGDMDKER